MSISNSMHVRIADLDARVRRLDWNAISESLWTSGFAMTAPLFSKEECEQIATMFPDDNLFRSITDMGKKGYGRGIYKYFKYPMPDIISELRTALYEFVAPMANKYNEALRLPERFPLTQKQLITECNKLGQSRPTPLMLHYDAGDFNCMHQDIYGDLTFPLQATIFLSEPGVDYQGGEFLLSEQRPRMQARIHALKPHQGQMVLFTTRHRPEPSAKGFRKVNVKHGVATVESGHRDTFGIIFHDAK